MASGFKPCSIADCNGNAHWTAYGGRGWCPSHFERWRKHGDPLGGGVSRGAPARWLHAHVTFDGRECLIWPFSRNSQGRGTLKVNGRTDYAHREMCKRAHGEPPTPTHEAAHSCGKGHEGCVNPNHLRWATTKQNKQDSVSHGTWARGESCGSSKLAEADVAQIRRLRGLLKQREIAEMFGISPQNVGNIQQCRTWRG
jgi:hypothetical protein